MKIFKKSMIVAASLLAAVWAGLVFSPDTCRSLIIALLLLASALVALIFQVRNYFLGLGLLVVTAVAFPIQWGDLFGGALNSSLILAAFVCLSWVLTAAFVRRSFFESSRVVISVLIFMTIVLLSFLTGQFPWYHLPGAPLRAQVGELGLFLLSGSLFLVVGHQIDRLTHLRRLTWLFLGAGAFTCILIMVPEFNNAAKWIIKPESVGSLFWTWLIAISFSQAILNRNLTLAPRFCLMAITVLALSHCLLQRIWWVSGWLPPLVAIGIIIIFRAPRFGLGLLCLAPPTYLLLSKQIEDLLMISEQYSWMTRLEAWRVLWELVARNPFLGLGLANYYYYTLLFPIFGWYVSFSSHNNYVDVVAQTGFLGLLAFSWFIYEVFRMSIRVRFRVPAGFAQAYVVGAIGGLSGTLVSGLLGDWIIPFVYNVGIQGFRSSMLFWIFIGGILALKRITSDQESEVEASATRRVLLSQA